MQSCNILLVLVILVPKFLVIVIGIKRGVNAFFNKFNWSGEVFKKLEVWIKDIFYLIL